MLDRFHCFKKNKKKKTQILSQANNYERKKLTQKYLLAVLTLIHLLRKVFQVTLKLKSQTCLLQTPLSPEESARYNHSPGQNICNKMK